MSWEKTEKRANDAASGTGIYLSLRSDGDSAVGSPCGEPETRDVVWIGGKSEEYDPARHQGEKVSTRFLVNFWTEQGMKIWEMGPTVFKQLCTVRRKYGNKHLLEITRRGSGMDTEYTILPDRAVDHELGDRIAKAELLPLLQPAKKPAPITDSAADALKARLRKLPAEIVAQYLSGLGVARVSEIAFGQLDAARAALDALEVDPFA